MYLLIGLDINSPMIMPSIEQILTWAKDNQLMLGLLASATIGSMPEMLPSFKEIPQWTWTWFRSSAKTFLNFRMNLTEPTIQQQRINAVQKGNQAKHELLPDPTTKVDGPQQLNG
jgi:hypothetical protein